MLEKGVPQSRYSRTGWFTIYNFKTTFFNLGRLRVKITTLASYIHNFLFNVYNLRYPCSGMYIQCIHVYKA